MRFCEPSRSSYDVLCPHHRHLDDGGVGGGRRKNQSKPWAVWDWAVVRFINLGSGKRSMLGLIKTEQKEILK
jgi:hypothetical protein